MSIYAVGDIQGCYKCLRRLLKQARFAQGRDRLWCVGDLVNRGNRSLDTLRFLQDMGDRCTAVLGNHDLHLLHAAAGGITPPPTLRQVLDAPDRDTLIDWLRHRPLLHRDDDLGWMMIHAALHPRWSLRKAEKQASRINKRLRHPEWRQRVVELLQTPLTSENKKSKAWRRAMAVAVLTRGRFCTADGRFNWRNSSCSSQRSDEAPWFAHQTATWRKEARKQGLRVVFGHWAAMGLVTDQTRVLGLDSGCVWGGRLTLARIDKKKPRLISVDCDGRC